MKTSQILLALVICVISCDAPKEEYAKAEYSDNIQLFEYSKELTGVYSSKNKSLSPTQLTLKEMTEIEGILRTAFEENGEKLQGLNSYKRQYVPTITNFDEKVIWVNMFCSDSIENWRTQIVFVLDGGNCFFNLKVNLATGKHYQLAINGDG